MTAQDRLIADLAEQRDRARAITVTLEQETHNLRQLLSRAGDMLDDAAHGELDHVHVTHLCDQISRALAVQT